MEDHNALSTIVTSTELDLLIQGWLHANKQSEKTFKAYQDTINQFRAALQHEGLDLDRQDGPSIAHIALIAQAYASFSARGKKVAPATINQRLAIISSFYSYWLIDGKRRAVTRINPIDGIKREKVQAYGSVQVLDDTTSMLEAIDRSTLSGKRDYALLSVLLFTSRRAAEAENLDCRNLSLKLSGKITVTFENCKGGKTMTDELPHSITHALLEWLKAFYGDDFKPGVPSDHRPVFVCLVNGTHKKRDGTATQTRRGDRLGYQAISLICEKWLQTSKAHATRHKWAHTMDTLGAPVSLIQAKLGHESLATTGRYLAQIKSSENPYAEKLAANLGIK